MHQDAGMEIKSMKVDGGAVHNDWLMQFQADELNAEVVRPVQAEATVMGAAYMAGLATGYWPSPEEAFATLKIERVFRPAMAAPDRERLYEEWTKAVHHAMGWLNKG
jgi:glycerol kinase